MHWLSSGPNLAFPGSREQLVMVYRHSTPFCSAVYLSPARCLSKVLAWSCLKLVVLSVISVYVSCYYVN